MDNTNSKDVQVQMRDIKNILFINTQNNDSTNNNENVLNENNNNNNNNEIKYDPWEKMKFITYLLFFVNIFYTIIICIIL